jgi:hypothetical protein
MTQSPSKRFRLELPREAKKRGKALLNQQMWLWGQDILAPAGNLLYAYGFTHTRPPAGIKGSSMYMQPWGEGQVTLWGFGFCFAPGCGFDASPTAVSALYLKRYQFAPRLGPASAPFWEPDAWPNLPAPQSAAACEQLRQSLVAALHWLSQYEAWVLTAAGPDYRQQALAAWSHKPVQPATQMAEGWWGLAEMCEKSVIRET